MRDGDSGEPAHRPHDRLGRRIEERDAIPEQGAGRRRDEAGGGAAESAKEVPQAAQRKTVIAHLPSRRIGVEGRARAR